MVTYHNYYVNKNPQSNGDHEVHKEECRWLPALPNRQYLGYFDNCRDAVKEAGKYYKTDAIIVR